MRLDRVAHAGHVHLDVITGHPAGRTLDLIS